LGHRTLYETVWTLLGFENALAVLDAFLNQD
jgi:hypothetical protein